MIVPSRTATTALPEVHATGEDKGTGQLSRRGGFSVFHGCW